MVLVRRLQKYALKVCFLLVFGFSFSLKCFYSDELSDQHSFPFVRWVLQRERQTHEWAVKKKIIGKMGKKSIGLQYFLLNNTTYFSRQISRSSCRKHMSMWFTFIFEQMSEILKCFSESWCLFTARNIYSRICENFQNPNIILIVRTKFEFLAILNAIWIHSSFFV